MSRTCVVRYSALSAMSGTKTGVQASPLSDLRDHVGLLNQQKCVEDQFSWFESLGGLLCSTTVLCKRIVFAMNASEKDVIFSAKYHL